MFLFIRNESFESSNINFSSNPQKIDNHNIYTVLIVNWNR